MLIHKDKELFEQLILASSDELKIPSTIIEKDYYVYIILKRLRNKVPNLLFKGGTSLSKCYKIINRFSEDIDLTIIDDFTEGKRKSVKSAIIETCEELMLDITNLTDTKSRRNYNKYEVDYDPINNMAAVKDKVYLETVFKVKSFPSVTKKLSSYIYDYLIGIKRNDIVESFELAPFDINVQTIERTFIDKVFALCDYAYDKKLKEHSRHIYDIYKMYSHIKFDDDFKNLVENTRKARNGQPKCFSAQEGFDINEYLKLIVKNEVYKYDYNNITKDLLLEEVSYEEAVGTIITIINKNIF